MAIKININQVLSAAERRKREEPVLPKIKVTRSKDPAPKKETEQPALLKDLWDKMVAVKKDRAKLSTQTAALVDQVHAELLSKEGPTVAQEFMLGNVPDNRVARHWAEIQAYTEKAITLYDQIKYVEQHGGLPSEDSDAPMVRMCTPDVSVMQLEVNRLRDLICKTKKKIAIGKAYNPMRITEWYEKLALAEARRDDLRLKIKKLQSDARKRASS